ncbi:MAG TPA: hypothetical protein DEH78_30835, partial [Solibacterales bacterium]|nr:hypothetical protein [Bryobacterales bacterium]
MSGLKAKLSHLFRRSRFDQALDEEIRFHIEHRAQELAASGLDKEAAMAAARREFGSAARLSEEAREAWRWTWLEDLSRDLRHAARSLRRDRALAAVAIVSLALGIGVNTTIFSVTSEMLFSKPSVRDPDTLFNVRVGGGSNRPISQYEFLRDAKVFEGLAGAAPMQEINWRTGDTSRRLFVTLVTENYFEVTGTPIALGRALGANEPNSVIVSHGFWQSRLSGKPNVLGQTLILDGRPYTIVGVLPDGHRTLTGFGYAPDLYLQLTTRNGSVALYGRIASGDTRQAAQARLQAAAAQLDQAFPDPAVKYAREVSVIGLVGVERLADGFLPTVSAFFGLLMAVVVLLLLIACANVASLLLARATARVHEFAVRASIGAGRGRLLRQLLAESLLLSVAGTAAGLGLNFALTRNLNNVTLPLPFPVKLSMQTDARLLLYSAMLAIGSALLAGLLPALKSSKASAAALLKQEEHQVSGRRAGLRSLLVSAQLAVSVLVLILAALSLRNLVQSATLDPGFDLQRTAWAQMRLVPEAKPAPENVRATVLTALERLRATPGVEAATTAFFVPLNDHFAFAVRTVWGDQSPDGRRVEHSWNAVGPDYFRTMSIGIVAGREFTEADRAGSQRVAILNEAFARIAFGSANPVGQLLTLGRRDDRYSLLVVGVARNAKYSTIGEKNRPALYEPYLQVGGGRTMLHFLVRAAGSPDAL